MDEEEYIMEDKEEFAGKEISYTTVLSHLKNGQWEAETTMIHRRSKDLIDWATRKVVLRYLADTEGKAFSGVTITMNEYLKSLDYDLFNAPEETKELLQ